MILGETTRAAFLERNRPRRILVNSIPKSGTTWMRTMLAALPGYSEHPRATGTDARELANVAVGQVFHGHLMSSPGLFRTIEQLDFAGVYVYRDLRDVVVSNYFHLAHLNPNRAPAWFHNTPKEELMRADCIERWCSPAKRYPDVRNWLRQQRVPTVTYEALKHDAVGQMRRVLEHMGFWCNDELVEYIVQAGSFERAAGRPVGEEMAQSPQRKGVVGDWRNHFTAEHIAQFKKAYGDLLIEYGYESDMNW